MQAKGLLQVSLVHQLDGQTIIQVSQHDWVVIRTQ